MKDLYIALGNNRMNERKINASIEGGKVQGKGSSDSGVPERYLRSTSHPCLSQPRMIIENCQSHLCRYKWRPKWGPNLRSRGLFVMTQIRLAMNNGHPKWPVMN